MYTPADMGKGILQPRRGVVYPYYLIRAEPQVLVKDFGTRIVKLVMTRDKIT